MAGKKRQRVRKTIVYFFLNDKIHKVFTDSPITARMTINDLCYRGVGFIGQHNKETKTSWDTLSYTLIQGHNVYQHMVAVQEANRKYDNSIMPSMLIHEQFDKVLFKDVVDEIISQPTRESALNKIEEYNWFWNQFKSGSQGFSGKKTTNSMTNFDKFFDMAVFTNSQEEESVEDIIDDIEILEGEEMWASRVIDENKE